MKYYDVNTAKQATREKIETLRKYAGIIPVLKETARRFDNKVWNCRLLKAFNEASSEYIMIKLYNDNYYGIYGFENSEYITLGRAYIKDMANGKRINAPALCDSFNECREKLLQEAANIENQLNNINSIKSQLDALKKTYEGITNSLEYTIIENFSIPMYIR